MVLRLVADIPDGNLLLRYPDAERSILFLPSEPFCSLLIVHPFGRARLDELHCLGNGNGCGQREQEMSMVPHSSDGQRLHAIGASNATHVGPEFRLQLVGYQRTPFVRRKDIMYQDAGVGHKRSLSD